MATPHQLQMWMRKQVLVMEEGMARPDVRPISRAYLERCRELMLQDLLASQIENFNRG